MPNVASGTSGSGASGGRVTVMRSPAATACRLGRATPSTSTCPPSISRWAAAREPAAGARNTSSRSPAASGPTTSSSPSMARRSLEHVEQGEDAERNRDVGDVEGGPPREIDEVRHRPVARAVDQVAGGAADQQAGREPDQRPLAVAGEEDQQRGQGGDREQHEQDAAVGEHPERDPAVADVHELEAEDEVDRVAALDRRAHDRLGHLVGGHGDDRHQRRASGRAHAFGSIRPTTMPPTIRSTRIATIGVRSSGPIRSGRRRKRRRYGSVTSRRKSSTALSGREYGTRMPIAKTK